MHFRFVFSSIALLAGLLTASAGHADATRYVAANGSGSTCTQAAPCPNLGTALGIAAAGDTIVCLSPPVPGALDIQKPITIDCSSARATFAGGGAVMVADSSVVNVVINVPAGIVRLRGLTIASPADRGIDIQAAAAVFIEDCVISGSQKQGIFDHRTGGQTRLFINDTIISNTVGPGIVAASQSVGITVLDNVRSENNAFGIAVARGNNVVINRSVFSGNANAGVEGDPGAQIVLDNSTITHNNIGIISNSAVRLSNNNIAFNNTAISGTSGTFGNNRFSANASLGTAPTALGGTSSDLGQQ